MTGPDGRADRFDVDSFRKDCLLSGVDEISFTLAHESQIAAYEARRQAELDPRCPWP